MAGSTAADGAGVHRHAGEGAEFQAGDERLFQEYGANLYSGNGYETFDGLDAAHG
ncbi:hypothetical protein ESCNG_10032 [Neisseria gonorrhoeae]|nr:hypothetical protein ESCNG_10032 [Neisseria gonorrhoeae]